ncbi:MAG: hypothetical protein IT422_27005 [Pirellulaceae bacterium]|nr:hypothetical protein [Pirellulaceae bacterium]
MEQIAESPREKAATVWHLSHTQAANATDKSGLVSFEASLIEQTIDPTKPTEAVVKVHIKRGSYVYGDVSSSAPFTPLAIRATEETVVSVDEITLPITIETEAGKPVYRDSFSVRIPMNLTSPEDGTFRLHYEARSGWMFDRNTLSNFGRQKPTCPPTLPRHRTNQGALQSSTVDCTD